MAGPFSHLLGETLPLHEIEPETTWRLVLKIITAPATWLALLVVALGLVAWWKRDALRWISEPLQDVGWVAEHSFGFEAINRAVVRTIQNLAEELRGLQTGLLNWNVVGIVVALVVVLLVVALGA